MIKNARYAHTNLVARDWRRLAQFYETVFGCEPVPPERDYSGEALDAGTGLSGAHLTGVHLRLPGHGDDGPTLEIFHYDELAERETPQVNTPGYGHLCFVVGDVDQACREVLANGGEPVGEVVTLSPAPEREVTWCYIRDPEGNIVELQSWN